MMLLVMIVVKNLRVGHHHPLRLPCPPWRLRLNLPRSRQVNCRP